MQRLRLREVEQLAHGHLASQETELGIGILEPVCLGPNPAVCALGKFTSL